MKKIVVVLFFLGILIFDANAQNDIRFGFQFSPSLSWMGASTNTVNRNGSVILGAKLGVIGEYYFRENYAFTSGIGFAFNHSGRLRHDNGGEIWTRSDLQQVGLDTFSAGTTLKYNLQYVEIPVSLKLMSGYFGTSRFYAEIPILYYGFNTKARGSSEGNGAIEADGEDINKDVKFFNISWGFGGGMEYELGSQISLVAGLYYQQGFTDVTKNVSDDKSKATLSAITIRLGVMF